ncbi:MAG: PilT/PilU family type 4a pilus ATPase [Cyanobium sp. PLM2.Bin73]|nr:MAG: PilT/PilU family type 4a pilus ATPase [Cyanobium sp. PLM2.Bin73]
MTTAPLPPPSPLPHSPLPPPPLPTMTATFPEQPATLEALVRLAHEREYSDVHLGVGEEPRYRSRGTMVRTGWPLTDADLFHRWLREILSPDEIEAFYRQKEFDGSHSFPFARVRINLLDTLSGPAMVLRLIPHHVPTLDELGMPAVLRELCTRPKGMVLVTGPTGCGKTTTLAAMIDWINRNMYRHVVTIEDPIEYVHTSAESLIRQRQVGQHTLEFHNALRASMREDPDVILIGEIRDRLTLATAIEASQTGQLVFGTLHTNSAVKTVERVLGMHPPNEQDSVRQAVSESLLAVIAQGLIKTSDGKRTVYQDILINTDACRDYIQRGELDEIEEIMRRSRFDGMVTANQSLLELVESGRVEQGEALAQSLRPSEMLQAFRGRTS